MSTPDNYVSEHLIARGGFLRAGHEAASTAGFSEVRLVRRSGGISRVSADGDVIAAIASAGTSPARANRKVERAATVGLMHAERAVELALAGEVSAAHQDG